MKSETLKSILRLGHTKIICRISISPPGYLAFSGKENKFNSSYFREVKKELEEGEFWGWGYQIQMKLYKPEGRNAYLLCLTSYQVSW